MAKSPAPSKPTAVTDPLEAAKIVSKPIVPPPPPPEAKPDLAQALPEAPPEPVVAPPKKYRVVEDASISLHGQFIKLHKGTVLSESSYGPAAMRRLLENEKLVLVEHKEE
jgi:hypothetical protein